MTLITLGEAEKEFAESKGRDLANLRRDIMIDP